MQEEEEDNLNIWTLAKLTSFYCFICLKYMIAHLWIKTVCHQNIRGEVTEQDSVIPF